MFAIEVANAAIRLWRGDTELLRYVTASANYVYSFIESDKTRYLRLTPSGDRTKGQIEAELDFIPYLRRGGVSAMLPAPSAAGRLVEELPFANGFLYACVFEGAQGE